MAEGELPRRGAEAHALGRDSSAEAHSMTSRGKLSRCLDVVRSGGYGGYNETRRSTVEHERARCACAEWMTTTVVPVDRGSGQTPEPNPCGFDVSVNPGWRLQAVSPVRSSLAVFYPRLAGRGRGTARPDGRALWLRRSPDPGLAGFAWVFPVL